MVPHSAISLRSRARLLLAMRSENPAAKVTAAILMVGGLTGIGTVGFALIEDLSPIDALYMTVIPLSTVGYQEVAPAAVTGRLWTIGSIVVGVGVTLYAVVSLAEFLVEGRLQAVPGETRDGEEHPVGVGPRHRVRLRTARPQCGGGARRGRNAGGRGRAGCRDGGLAPGGRHPPRARLGGGRRRAPRWTSSSSTPGPSDPSAWRRWCSTPPSSLVGCALRELGERGIEVGVVVLQRESEPPRVNPDAGTRLRAGDRIVVVGDSDALARVAADAQGQDA